jgi:hypothetical protein
MGDTDRNDGSTPGCAEHSRREMTQDAVPCVDNTAPASATDSLPMSEPSASEEDVSREKLPPLR